MHPALLLIPAAALILAPRLWVREVLQRHNRTDIPLPGTASEVARAMLDNHQLNQVAVELTDAGDHYDPAARAVRISRDKFDRKTLTAVTTAAHEVAHALQHATGYPPFRTRERLVRVARVTGQAGTALLLAVPATALLTRQALPTKIIGAASLSMLGVGAAAQLSALPTEFDASFNRALPMLKSGYLEAEQLAQAKKILIACSASYLSSSLIGVIHLWPWLGGGRFWLLPPRTGPGRDVAAVRQAKRGGRLRGGDFERIFRRLARPVVKQWLKAGRQASHHGGPRPD